MQYPWSYWYSSTMLDHHIQRTIVTTLKSAKELSFSELHPRNIENKLFTYHLKITIREGFVEKTPDGKYKLTATGRKLWRRMNESPEQFSMRAISVFYLAVHHQQYGWLLYKRRTHPLNGRVGFMHAHPNSSELAVHQASKEMKTKTGLDGTFSVIGTGFFRTLSGTTLDSFTNFTLMLCEDVSGELAPTDDAADYFWTKQIPTTDPDILPNMPHLLEAISSGQYPFFIDEVVHV